MSELVEYRAACGLPGNPGMRRGETAWLDIDSAPYLKAWVEGGYLVATERVTKKRKR